MAAASRATRQRGEQIRLVLERAHERGERVPDLFTVLDRLLAPLYLRFALGYRPDDDDLTSLIENALQD